MSEERVDIGLQKEIASLRGKEIREVYTYFKELFGDSLVGDVDIDLDENDGRWDYFRFRNIEFGGKVFSLVTDFVGWGVRLELNKKSYLRINMGIGELIKLEKDLEDMFGEGECRLVAYEWYTGADEPISF